MRDGKKILNYELVHIQGVAYSGCMRQDDVKHLSIEETGENHTV